MKRIKLFALLLCAFIIPTIMLMAGCNKTKTKPQPEPEPHVHVFSAWQQSVPASCTETGLMRRDCVDCDYFETSTIAALGHNFEDWHETTHPTCTTGGEQQRSCLRCGELEKETLQKLGHDFSDGWKFSKTEHYHYCIRCGTKADDSKAMHNFSLNEGNECSVCGYDRRSDVLTFAKTGGGGLLFC